MNFFTKLFLAFCAAIILTMVVTNANAQSYELKNDKVVVTLYPEQGWCLPNQRKGIAFFKDRISNKLVRFCFIVHPEQKAIFGIDEEGDFFTIPLSAFSPSPGT